MMLIKFSDCFKQIVKSIEFQMQHKNSNLHMTPDSSNWRCFSMGFSVIQSQSEGCWMFDAIQLGNDISIDVLTLHRWQASWFVFIFNFSFSFAWCRQTCLRKCARSVSYGSYPGDFICEQKSNNSWMNSTHQFTYLSALTSRNSCS